MLCALLAILPLQDWLTSFRAAADAEDPAAAYERCLELAPENATTAYHLAAHHAREGRDDDAFEWLERAVDWGYADDAVLAWDEDFGGLREDARFAPLVERAAAVTVEPRETVMLWNLPERTRAFVTGDDRRAFVPAQAGILIWDLEDEALVDVLDGHTRSHALTLDPGGRVLVGVTGPARVQAWRVSDRAEIWDVTLPDRIDLRSLHFSGGGTRVVLRGARRVLHLDLEDGAIVERELEISNTARFEAAGGVWQGIELPSPTFTPSREPQPLGDDEVALVTGRGQVRVLATKSASRVASVRLGTVWTLASCGEWLVAVGGERVRFVHRGELGREWIVPGERAWSSPAAPRVLVVSGTLARIHDLEQRRSTPEIDLGGRIEDAAWSGDGAHVAFAVGDTVRVWDTETATPTPELYAHPGRVIAALDFSPDGRWLSTGSVYRGPPELELRVHTWNRETGDTDSAVISAGLFASNLQQLRYIHEGAQLLVAWGGLPEVEVRAADTLEVLWRHEEFNGGPNWVQFHLAEPDELWISGDYDSRVLRLSNGVARHLFDEDITDLVPSPDGQRAFVIRDGALEILDGRTFAHLVTRVEFPDDGELVHLPSGWFRGTDEALVNTWLLVDGRASRLVDHAEELYDPKRVAAGAAGVRVRPPLLR